MLCKYVEIEGECFTAKVWVTYSLDESYNSIYERAVRILKEQVSDI